MRVHGGGWLLASEAGAEAIHSRLLELRDQDSDRLAAVSAVIAWQSGPGRAATTACMAAAYRAQYDALLRPPGDPGESRLQWPGGPGGNGGQDQVH